MCTGSQRTVKCWNSHALMMLVASFGNMPRFFCCLCPFISESSSAVPSPDPMLLSRPSPAESNEQPRNYHKALYGNYCTLYTRPSIFSLRQPQAATPYGQGPHIKNGAANNRPSKCRPNMHMSTGASILP